MKKSKFKSLLESLILEIKIENDLKNKIKTIAGYSNAVEKVEEKNKMLIVYLKDKNVFGGLSNVLKKKYFNELLNIVKKEYKTASFPVYSNKNLTLIFKI